MRRLRILIIIVAFAGSAYGQTFDVASIRENKLDDSGIDGRRIGIETNPGSLTMRNVTLMSCIRWAYNVYDFQISGGPDWRNSARYDIVARPAAAASDDQLRMMLRALLADRFKLVLRMQIKETPVYVLGVDKNGHKLRAAKIDGPRGMRPDGVGIGFQNTTMSDLQQFLSTMPPIDRPVLERTGLEGSFDFTLTLFSNQPDGGAVGLKGTLVGAGATAFADALARLGLKFEAQKVPLDAIAIEKAEKPSEN